MKIFRCDNLVPGCPYVYKGETEDDVFENILIHARDHHEDAVKEILKKMSDVEMNSYLKSLIEEA